MQRLTHKRESGMKSGYWSPNKKQELVDRLAMYEDAAEKDSFGKWIPCSERLPEDGQDVLVYTEKGYGTYKYLFARHTVVNYTDCWKNARTGLSIFYNVIAWTPLPEPYKEGVDE